MVRLRRANAFYRPTLRPGCPPRSVHANGSVIQRRHPRVTATDKDGATSSATSAITVNPAVTADAGGPYTIAEGQTLTLDATGSLAGPTATYAWDLDGDGQFDDATGPTPQLSPDELAALGLADGPAGPLPITLRVTEGPTVGTATATYAIRNLAPVPPCRPPAPLWPASRQP